MTRYTKKDAEQAFARLCELMGKTAGHYRKLEAGETSTYGSATHTTIPGGWALDYNPTYGGYVVEEISSDPAEHPGELMDGRRYSATSVSMPFGYTRRSAREFVQMVADLEAARRIAGAS